MNNNQNKIYTEISKCRLCGNSQIELALTLGNLALTGYFPRSSEEKIPSGPIELVKCNEQSGCGLVQLRQSYDQNAMYGMHYGYQSSLNSSMIKHLRQKVERIVNSGILSNGDLIIDVGSNDATTLKCYPDQQFDLVGIDPTGAKFIQNYKNPIQLVAEFFSEDAVRKASKNRKAKVITSFSMFYDLEDPLDFARIVEKTLDDNGIWVLEQSYLPSMINTNSFDTICHEHIEFYALHQINWICENSGLRIIDVEFNEINGGSFSIEVAKKMSNRKTNSSQVSKILDEEKRSSIGSIKSLKNFETKVRKCKADILKFLETAKTSGKSVYGLGASTKGNVLLQYCEINNTLVKAIGEVNSDKFGTFTPGSGIPILPENFILSQRPDFLLVLPWHFKRFFLTNPALNGLNLVFPLPELEVVKVKI
jgi:hypothetical protein